MVADADLTAAAGVLPEVAAAAAATAAPTAAAAAAVRRLHTEGMTAKETHNMKLQECSQQERMSGAQQTANGQDLGCCLYEV